MRTINIPKELHTKLKLEATKQGISIMALLTRIITNYLATLCVMLMFVGCGTVSYVKVDKVNMDRFTHDQKIVEGLSRQEVLDKFGSPDQAFATTFGAKGAIVWRYNYKIFCSQRGTRCDVYFRNDSVIYTSNFRMEFSNLVSK